MNIQLKKFDMDSLKNFSSLIICGGRNKGKSTIIKDVMYHKRNIPVGTVISPTEQSNQFFEKFIPKIFIHHEYQKEIIENLIKRQKRLKKRINKFHEEIDERSYLILDDCMYDNSWKKDKCMREIMFNGRHLGLDLTIVSIQDPMGLPPSFRVNGGNYVFMVREPKLVNKKKLYDNYCSMFPTFEIFCAVLDQCTENWGCLVIDNTSTSGKLEDQVFWYKADLHDKFQVGPNEIWQYSEENYIDEDDEEEGINVNTFTKKKLPKVNIKKIQA